MDAIALQDIFVKILRSELTETAPDDAVKSALVPEILPELYQMAKAQDLAHIVSSALGKMGLLGKDEISAKFKKQEFLSLYRWEGMKFDLSRICEILETADIPYVLLKGSHIRPYYPKESMRTSCDVDILVREEQVEAAIQALQDAGYRMDGRHYHDISFYSESGVHLELHFSIMEIMDRLDVVLKDAWKYTVQKEGKLYTFTNGFFMFHMFAHMYHHFLQGGCGIRSVIDVWIMEHKMGISLEDAKVFLEQAGIYQFAKGISELADICFSGKEATSDSALLLTYILNGGIYSGTDNQAVIQKAGSENTISYICKRIFLPCYEMKVQYHILKKLPFLLPFCWIARVFRVLFSKKAGQTMSELKTAGTLSGKQMDDMKRLREHLGL